MLFDKERALCRSWIDWWREHYVDNQAQRLKCKISKCPVKGYFILGPIKIKIKSVLYSYNRQKVLTTQEEFKVNSENAKNSHEIFDHFFICPKNPIWTGKNGFAKSFVFASIFAKNVCLCCTWVRGQYADTTMTTRTPTANFEGFSQTLKRQSGEKSMWVCLWTQ